jgi:hypothetical protein
MYSLPGTDTREVRLEEGACSWQAPSKKGLAGSCPCGYCRGGGEQGVGEDYA